MIFDFLKNLFRKNKTQENPQSNFQSNFQKVEVKEEIPKEISEEHKSSPQIECLPHQKIKTFEKPRPYSFSVCVKEPIVDSDNELEYFSNLTLDQHFERLKKAQETRAQNDEHYKLVVVDLETTGQSVNRNEILQIAIIDENGRKLLNQYCKPRRIHEWERSIEIHGISPILVQNCPYFSDIKPYVIDILSRTEKIVSYDRDVSDYFEKYKMDFSANVYVGCYYREYYNVETGSSEKWINLEEAANASVGIYDCGDSLEDAKAILKIYNFLVEQKNAYENEREKRNQDKKAKNTYKQNKNANPNHPLYGKKIAFSDELPITREEAFERSANVGAIPRSSVTKTVDILVCGTRSKMWACHYGKISAEEKQAEKINEEGGSIELMPGEKFMALLNRPAGDPEKVSTVDT